jgi:hypothetical protein
VEFVLRESAVLARPGTKQSISIRRRSEMLALNAVDGGSVSEGDGPEGSSNVAAQ